MATLIDAPTARTPAECQPILQRLNKLFSSSKYSDLKITCGDFGWDVHRVIVCSASDFFEKCCTNFKEAQTGVIDLSDDNRHAVEALLRYFYTEDYDDEIAVADAVPILFNVQVHTIADKYNVPELCKLAEAKFAKRAETEWKTEGFAEAVFEMFATSPESKKTMQDSAVSTAVEHAEVLFKAGQTTKFHEMSQSVAPFSHGVSVKLMASHLGTQTVNEEFRPCKRCRKASHSFMY